VKYEPVSWTRVLSSLTLPGCDDGNDVTIATAKPWDEE
jgi:hypothetical protein